MSTLHAYGDLLTASIDDRVLTYRLLPYGEQGRTSAGRLTAARGVVTLPADPTTLVANIEHDRTRPVARFVSVTDDEDALHATLRVLPTTAGNDLLVEAAEGVRTGISVELDGYAVRSGHLTSGTLTGAGFVAASAFPSAQLVASDTPDADPDDEDDDQDDDQDKDDEDDEDHDDEPASDPPDTTPTDDPDGDDDKEHDVNSTLTAAAPSGLRGTPPAAARLTARDMALALASAYNEGGTGQLTAALSDIKSTGAGAVGVAALPPEWVGEVWSGRAYQRRYVPLATPGTLTSLNVLGWRWTTKPEVDAWAGNKTAVPSNVPETESVSAAASRLAGAHDVDRSFVDFPNPEFWTSYWSAMTESYARKSDAAALAAFLAGATPVTGTGALADTSPWSMIVDGAIAILDTVTPQWAIVGADLYRSALLTPQNEALALLSAALGLESGTLGSFTLVPSSDPALLSKVLVGAREAVTFKELPGVPIRVEGVQVLDQVKGGVNPGLFGYFATIINDADALALVSKPLTAARSKG